MATRKSPARGTGSRPAKAAAGRTHNKPQGKPQSEPQSEPLKLSVKPAVAETAAAPLAIETPTAARMAAVSMAEVIPVEATPVEPAVTVDEPVTDNLPETLPETAPEPAAIDAPAPADNVVAFGPTTDDDAAPETAAPDESEVEADAESEVEADAEIETEVEAEIEAEVEAEPVSAPAWVGTPVVPLPGLPEMPAFGAAEFASVDMGALMASGTVLAEGMQSLGDELLAFSRQAMERNVGTAMAVLGASSIEEVVDLQSRHAVATFDDLITESTRLTGMAIEVAGKAVSSFKRA